MNKKLLVIIVLGLVLIGAVGALYYYTQPKNNDTTQNATDLPKKTPAKTPNETITYTDNGFSPSNLVAKSGDTVKIVNNSSSNLEFSSGSHPTHLEDPELNMPVLKPGESAEVVVTTVGEHSFHNHLNDAHTGILKVE